MSGEVFSDIYADHGCSVAPSCLNCPLPVCKYDAPRANRTVKRITQGRSKPFPVPAHPATRHKRGQKQWCINGHEYTTANRRILNSGTYQCRACDRERTKARRATKEAR